MAITADMSSTKIPLLVSLFIPPALFPFFSIHIEPTTSSSIWNPLITTTTMAATKMEVGVLMVVLTFVAVAVVPSMAVDYPVSWSSGTDYSSWGVGKTITAGDTITFTYNSLHSVDTLSKADYDSCNTAAAVKSDSSGTTTITLDKPATTYYFACGTFGHCQGGMKLSVTTAAASGSTPSTPLTPPTTPGGSTTPATPSTPTTPTGSTGTTPKSSGSGAAVIGGMKTVAVGGIAAVLGLGLLLG